MLERLRVDLRIVEGEDELLDSQLNDVVNDAYGLIYALANFVSPILGSLFFTQLGSKKCFDLMFVADIIFAAVILTFNCGTRVF